MRCWWRVSSLCHCFPRHHHAPNFSARQTISRTSVSLHPQADNDRSAGAIAREQIPNIATNMRGVCLCIVILSAEDVGRKSPFAIGGEHGNGIITEETA